MLYITTFIVSFITTTFLFFKFFKMEQIDCYPYLDTVKNIEKRAIKDLLSGSYNLKQIDLQLKALNNRIKHSHKLLLDCRYVAVSKNSSDN